MSKVNIINIVTIFRNDGLKFVQKIMIHGPKSLFFISCGYKRNRIICAHFIT